MIIEAKVVVQSLRNFNIILEGEPNPITIAVLGQMHNTIKGGETPLTGVGFLHRDL
jgi:hypothetical protein